MQAKTCVGALSLAVLPMWIGACLAQESATVDPALKEKIEAQGRKIDAMRSRMAEQLAELEQMKRELASQEVAYNDLRKAVGMTALEEARATGAPGVAGAQSAPSPQDQVPGSPAPGAPSAPVSQPVAATQPVGKRPAEDDRPPEVAPIFDQPGVLTPRNKLIIEPSYQYGYSSSDRVSLVGYTVIPAILIGLVDVRQVKTTTQTGAVAFRYGLTNRMELEVRVPYVDTHTDTISREIFTGTAQDNLFTNSGKGIGDVEATLRYQINDGGADKPYYIGWFRAKSRTGEDPFEVTTDCVTRCVQNTTGTGLPLKAPTGTGFYSAQLGLTWLYPSDPVVFFGNFSYLHNFERKDVSRNVLGSGKQFLGDIKAGDIADISVGMGLSLNEKASISIGYDQAFVGRTQQNGHPLAGSARSTLGSLLIGGSYRFNEKETLNITLGVGVTRDTPDTTVTVRVPITL
ncbi:acetate kinase [Luteibacter aegosomaticola]|uniref:coiled-coil domain-containing protein n=1 Tax=Luteibacter aegosomaticola TaxID=2911538 RepID=UPI001FF8D914|nr:acetate kinase [Luteibacter aegosomaticola]UPG91304.1 acetate kinase [Luteibacter aegosomaticola]